MSSGASLTLEYSGDTQRVLKNYNNGMSTNSRLYLHGQNDYPLIERNKTTVSAETLAVYIYGLNGAVAKRVGSTVLFQLKDHLGSTRVVMDATGLVRTYYDYDALGNVIRIGTTNEVKYQFTGQEYDESGVHNYRARLYDSDLGKFYAVDPAGQDWSSFAYAGNNPVIMVDPDGRFPWLILAAAAYAGGGIANDHGNFLKWDWSSSKTYGGILAGASLAYGGLALAGAAPIIGSGLAGATTTGAVVGAGFGTGWGMVAIGNGRSGWDDLWKYTLTGSIAGGTIGFGSGIGLFSSSQGTLYGGLSGWGKVGASALFWSQTYASLNAMDYTDASTGDYWEALGKGAAWGALEGAVGAGYVQGTNWLFRNANNARLFRGVITAIGTANAIYDVNTNSDLKKARKKKGRGGFRFDEHSWGGFLDFAAGRFLLPDMPFLHDLGAIYQLA
jgi:RHS repeat-associated protein